MTSVPSRDDTAAAPGSTERTRVRRIPQKAVTDVAALHAILDAALVAHVGIVVDGQPFVVPVAFARRGDEVLIHGSRASRLFRCLAAGGPACLTVTLLDGLVLARSAFESSMNYRSVMVLGTARLLDDAEATEALRAISDHLLPGRWADIRPPSAKELAATMTLSIDLAESSVKIGSGDPDDDPADLAYADRMRIWAGRVPIIETFAEPMADPLTPADVAVPDYVRQWSRT